VHSQTTLNEFVDQFNNALRKIVEKEKFQDMYTNAKFKEVQWGL
jgi:hypothetical protein